MVNETHLQPSTKFKCPNYLTYASDRLNHRGGGKAILYVRTSNTVKFSFPDYNIWKMPSSGMLGRVALVRTDGVTSQKTAFFIVTAVNTSNLTTHGNY
jgi:hypothetical protein